ncbi:alpha/beta fold hydrolase [Bifidobacterium callimiconis]|uniref:alpha/beta fold hydrolase n=1 Tax=Bifidobacterium callimiconis TaxID=2306973 RepID=UPI001BDDBC28|nr:alpha/beta fold hydrolase [Bifidobacterium callimiconis]MBT1177716.1 alpha/beta fold hydrolase [Bifidobacterium callimiconis]
MQVQLIDDRHYAETMKQTVLPALAACRREGWMEPANSRPAGPVPTPGKLHYVCYDSAKFDAIREQGATATFRGAVVISHGFTEFAERFAELAWYLLLDGFSVCILEHRGHGYSPRDVDDESLVWIDDWHRYVDDLAKFCSTIGQDYAIEEPLYLYGHSMGGGIAAALLEQYPTIIDKAVLSAPMIALRSGMPLWLAPTVAELACAVGLGQHAAPGQKMFSENFDEDFYRTVSLPRARWVHDLRLRHPEYHTNAATFGWVREGLRMYKSIVRRSACERVEAPLLIFQAENDTYVLPKPQNRFATQVRAGGCPVQLVRLKGSRHEMTTERNEIMQQYVGRILDFLHTPLAEE